MKRATSSPSPGMQKKRQTISVGSRPASPSRTRATTCSAADSGRKFTNVPSPSSPPSRSMRSRSAAITIGIGCSGGVSSLKPPGPRPPASTSRSTVTLSRTCVSGFENSRWFQRSTITSDEEPMPSTKRPPLASASAAACWASTAGPRVNGFTTPVPSRIRSVHVGGQRQRREAVGAVGLAGPEVVVAGRLGAAHERLVRGERDTGERKRETPAHGGQAIGSPAHESARKGGARRGGRRPAARGRRVPALVLDRRRTTRTRRSTAPPARLSAWEVHPILRWLLLAAATAPFILAWIVIREHELSWPRGELTAVVGIAAFGLIGYTGLLDRPGSPSGAISLDLGFWLAFLGSVLMIVGGGMAAGQTERVRKPPGVM